MDRNGSVPSSREEWIGGKSLVRGDSQESEVGEVEVEEWDLEEEEEEEGVGDERTDECGKERELVACERRGKDQNGRSTEIASIVPPPKYDLDPEVSRAEPVSESLTTRQPSPVG